MFGAACVVTSSQGKPASPEQSCHPGFSLPKESVQYGYRRAE